MEFKSGKSIHLRRIAIHMIVILMAGTGMAYAGFRLWLAHEINQECKEAMRKFPGDKIDALISVLISDDSNLSVKNEAIWALGKLRNQKSLPLLKSLYTGKECNHSLYVCQR